jgi:hypothetical protein
MPKDDKIFEAGIHLGKALRHIAEAKLLLTSQKELLQLVNDLYVEATKTHNIVENELHPRELYEFAANNMTFRKGTTMTDDKFTKLLKIVQAQQLAIEKLAQQMGAKLPPQHLEPAPPELRPQDVVLNSLSPQVKHTLRDVFPIVPKGNTLTVFFKPGQASQAALDHITATVQSLLKQNKLPFAYTVQAA